MSTPTTTCPSALGMSAWMRVWCDWSDFLISLLADGQLVSCYHVWATAGHDWVKVNDFLQKIILWILFVTCFVIVCPFCCQAGSLTVVLSTLVLQYFFHSCFLWWLNFFVSCISLRVLCGCFIYSDEMFPATYPSVPWYTSLLESEWLQNFFQWMLFCDMLFNGVSILAVQRGH